MKNTEIDKKVKEMSKYIGGNPFSDYTIIGYCYHNDRFYVINKNSVITYFPAEALILSIKQNWTDQQLEDLGKFFDEVK